MTTSFRKPFEVIQRNIGTIVNGKYVLADDTGVKITVMATVQEVMGVDQHKIEASSYGRRAGRYIKIYTDTRLRCVNQMMDDRRTRYAGDLFLFDGSEYLLFGEANFQHLKGQRVAHWRYYATEAIEDSDMEHAP